MLPSLSLSPYINGLTNRLVPSYRESSSLYLNADLLKISPPIENPFESRFCKRSSRNILKSINQDHLSSIQTTCQ